MDIESEKNSLIRRFIHIHHSRMISFVRRHQTIQVAIQNSATQTIEILHRPFAIFLFCRSHIMNTDIKTQFTHHRNIRTEFHACILIPACHMGSHCLGREEMRIPPLDEDTFYRIRIIARPKLCEVFQRFIIRTSAATGAKHHRQVRIFGFYTFQNIIQSFYMFNI